MTKLVTLGDVALINPRIKKSPAANDIVSFLRMADVGTDGTTAGGIDRPYADISKGYTQFENGDILVAKITPCFENGKIAQATTHHFRAAGSTEFHIVRPKPGILDSRYLHHFLRQPSIRIEGERRMTGSAGQRRVPHSYLAGLRIPLPSSDEQRRIAGMLDQAGALLAKRRQSMALLGDLAESIFVDMFGDPKSNRSGWPVKNLGLLGQVQGGLQVTTKRKSLPLEVPYLRVANVYRNRLDLQEIKTIKVTEHELERTRLRKADLLVVEGHGNPKEIGRVAQWDDSIANCVHQNHLIRVRLGDNILPDYACALLNSQGGRVHLLRSANTTSGLNTISSSDVRAVPVILPPFKLQAEFVTKIDSLRQLRANQEEALRALDELFGSLETRAFKGEL